MENCSLTNLEYNHSLRMKQCTFKVNNNLIKSIDFISFRIDNIPNLIITHYLLQKQIQILQRVYYNIHTADNKNNQEIYRFIIQIFMKFLWFIFFFKGTYILYVWIHKPFFLNKSTGDNFIISIFHFTLNLNFNFVAIFC